MRQVAQQRTTGMRIGYLDCFSGISGDMLLGALVDAGVALETMKSALETIPFSGYELKAEKVVRGGISASRVRVESAEGHAHRGLPQVLSLIEQGSLCEEEKRRCEQVFTNLAKAEALVHNVDVSEVHFHEVGAVDAICDVVGAVVGLGALRLDALTCSAVALGGGRVQAAHGTLPVPAPATAELLKGLPAYGGPVDYELTTPTGAALLKTLAEPIGAWPEMTIETIAYGAGEREIKGFPNVLRLAVGTTVTAAETRSDHAWLLETNLDDMTGEEVAFCAEKLLAAGALDVFTTPIQMKKGRPGVKLSVLCAPSRFSALEASIWANTTTLGVRRTLWQRSTLRRTHRTVQTPWGEVRVKLGFLGEKLIRCEPEYEDCRRLAEAQGIPLRDVYTAARAASEAADGLT